MLFHYDLAALLNIVLLLAQTDAAPSKIAPIHMNMGVQQDDRDEYSTLKQHHSILEKYWHIPSEIEEGRDALDLLLPEFTDNVADISPFADYSLHDRKSSSESDDDVTARKGILFKHIHSRDHTSTNGLIRGVVSHTKLVLPSELTTSSEGGESDDVKKRTRMPSVHEVSEEELQQSIREDAQELAEETAAWRRQYNRRRLEV